MNKSSHSSMQSLTDSFVARLRRGERPSMEEYKSRFPEWSDEIEEVFPALEMLEQCRPEVDRSPTPLAVNDAAPDMLGEYRIIQEIGRGGMGVVYEAEHGTMCRRVALKVLPLSSASNTSLLTRFHHEARSAGQLHHSNIVPVFEVGRQGGLHYYAMQFIRGLNLDLVIEEVRRMRAHPTSTNNQNSVADDTVKDLARRRQAEMDVDLSRTIAINLVGDTIASEADHPHPDSVEKNENDDARDDAPSELSTASDVEGQSENPASENPTPTASAANLNSQHGSSEWSTKITTRQDYFRRVAGLVLQVADALEHAHHNRVLHRDIKPANLILDTEGVVWVTDFGLAKSDQDNLTQTGDIVGTLRYMAPERFEGRTDARSDIYSLGLTLYELCTLKQAFDQMDRASLIQQLSQKAPTRPRKIDSAIPRDLETIILKAIDRDPQKRYPSAAQFAADLQLFVLDRPIKARRISASERFWRVCRRNPITATMGACIAVLLICVAAGSIWFGLANRQLADDLYDETRRAKAAEKVAVNAYRVSRENLLRAHREQAAAQRRTTRQGRQARALASLGEAGKILAGLTLDPAEREREELALRNEAIAALAQPAIQEVHFWPVTAPWTKSATISDDKRRFAQSDENGNLRVVRIDKEEDELRIASPGHRAWKMQFSPDGRYLATKNHAFGASGDAQINVWDLQHPQTPILQVQDPSIFINFDFASSKAELAVASGKQGVNIYSLDDGRLIKNVPATFPYSALIQYSFDDRLAIAYFYTRELEIWNVAGEPQRLEHTQIQDRITSLAWDPTQARIAVGTTEGRIHYWRAGINADPQVLATHRNRVTQLHFQPASELLFSESWNGTVRVTELTSFEQPLLVEREGLRAPSRFLADGKHIYFSHEEGFGVWRVRSPPLRVLSSDRARKDATSVNFHPVNPRLLARTTNDQIEFWDCQTNRMIRTILAPQHQFMQFSPDGGSICAGGAYGMDRWSIEVSPPGEQELGVRLGDQTSLIDDATGCFEFTQSGEALVVKVGSSARVIDARDGSLQRQFGEHPGIGRLQLSQDERWLLTSTGRGYGLRLWDVSTGQLIRDLKPRGYGAGIVLSPDNELLVSKTRGEIEFWNVQDWSPARRKHMESNVRASSQLRFSPDGNLLATGITEYLPQLIDPSDGRTLALLEGPRRERIVGFEFSPDGRWLAIAGDQDAHIWRLDELRNQLSDLGLDWSRRESTDEAGAKGALRPRTP